MSFLSIKFMPKVTIVQVIYNNRKFIEPVFSAILAQTFKDFNVVAVISGNDDGGKELLMEKFPQVEIIDPGYNIGFAGGHNLVFEKYQSDFFQLVNPDMIMEPTYIEEMLKAFEDGKVGGASGKLYKVASDELRVTSEEFRKIKSNYKILDTTGVVISKSGRARDRGQHEVDNGQYDALTMVDAVSGAGCMYRAAALASIKLQVTDGKSTNNSQLTTSNSEFFDTDFHSYWEDVDLSWRMVNKGWKNVFVPTAIGYHGRAAGSSRGGYLHILDFIKHHRALPQRVLDLNYKNHIFMYLKNSRILDPQFFFREFFMFWYILFFETRTLKVIPEMFRLFPKMWGKRKLIKKPVLS